MNGIIVVDKPQYMTSHDVVSFFRRKTGNRHVGHSGTLDPMATGVLPLFFGKAARLIEYTSRAGDPEAKVYRCTMKLGLETDTNDIWGAPVVSGGGSGSGVVGGGGGSGGEISGVCEKQAKAVIGRPDEIERVLKSFEGPGAQKPPMYSAVKVEGRKLYEYARKGQSPDESLIKSREIYIKSITVNEFYTKTLEICFDIVCSRGVYVRTLCADAGKKLGCGAVMSGLRRLKSDGFSIESSVRLDSDRISENAESLLLPVDTPVLWMEKTTLSEKGARAFQTGQLCIVESAAASDSGPGSESGPDSVGPGPKPGQLTRVYGPGGFLGIGELMDNSSLKPKKVLAEH